MYDNRMWLMTSIMISWKQVNFGIRKEMDLNNEVQMSSADQGPLTDMYMEENTQVITTQLK